MNRKVAFVGVVLLVMSIPVSTKSQTSRVQQELLKWCQMLVGQGFDREVIPLIGNIVSRHNIEESRSRMLARCNQCVIRVRIPTKSAGDSERRRPSIPIEAGQGFR